MLNSEVHYTKKNLFASKFELPYYSIPVPSQIFQPDEGFLLFIHSEFEKHLYMFLQWFEISGKNKFDESEFNTFFFNNTGNLRLKIFQDEKSTTASDTKTMLRKIFITATLSSLR